MQTARCPTGVGSGSDRRRFRCSYLTLLFCYDEDACDEQDCDGESPFVMLGPHDDVNGTSDLASQAGQEASGNLVKVGNQSNQFAPT